MKRQAGVGALLLVCVGVVLGATVFRSDIAQATGLAQGVTVVNTPQQAVPVREQGTANVNVTNTLDVRDVAQEPASKVTLVPEGDSFPTPILGPVPTGKAFVLKNL